MSRLPAPSSVATRSTTTLPSPSSVAPVNRASSESGLPADSRNDCIVRAARTGRATLLVGERLDHPVGDVDALARVDDRILEDQVVLLVGGDLLDHLVRALLYARELLVAPQVQVLAEFALHPRQVARLVRKVPLLVAAVGFGHRRAVAIERG